VNRIQSLSKLLASGHDNALLRFSLANAYLSERQPKQALEHVRMALQFDPHYSAAWKLYGKVLATTGETQRAISAYQQGIKVAETRGDIQAAKEMKVFLKRLKKKALE
jgi:Tfp pilus assembly protein PilF